MRKVLSTLVVDDDEGVRNSVTALLEGLGHEVRTAADVSQAVKLIQAETPDVLICDHILGNETSFALATTEEFRRVPVRVLHTGQALDSLDDTTTTQFTGVVQKVAPGDALVAAIRHD